jgi:Flp pilus assembly protein CpaB
MRKTFLVLGAFLAFVFGIGIFLFLQFTRPVVVEVPVAMSDIPAGTVLRASLFRVSQFSNADPQTVSKWVTVKTWNTADGKVTNSDIRAGFPVAKSQINDSVSSQVETRLSLLLTDTSEYYAVIPAKPDEVGNFIQPGDRVDVILSIGDLGSKDALAVNQPNQQQNRATGAGAANVGSQAEVTQTSPMPITKLVMQNLTVLRVERNAPAANTANQQAQGQAQPEPTPVTANDVKRLYVRVDRDQLEVLSFVMNNGKHNFAVRAANAGQESLPSDGVTWADFVRWFYAQRGNVPDGAQPFNAISPSSQNSAGK